MLSKDIFVPLSICIDQTRRALVIVLPCYGALEIVGVIIIIIIITKVKQPVLYNKSTTNRTDGVWIDRTYVLCELAMKY